MTAEEQRIIGQLQQAVENLSTQFAENRRETRADFQTVFIELRDLKSNGCALGARNAKDIEHLQNMPARTVAIGAALVAILSGVVSVLAYLGRHSQ